MHLRRSPPGLGRTLRPRLGRGRFAAATALLLAAGFGFALVESVSDHTDDGCAVELHCFACHWSFSSTGIAALTIAPVLPVELSGRLEPVDAPLPADVTAPASASRSPPAA